MKLNISLIILLVSLVASFGHQARAIFNTSNNLLDCVYENLDDLGPQCRPLKVFNRFQLDAMPSEQRFELAKVCACQLSNLPWHVDFDHYPAFRRVKAMIDSLLTEDKYSQTNRYPEYLWSDVDILAKGISVKYSMEHYFRMLLAGRVPREQILEHEMKDFAWRDIRLVCNKVATDRYHLYGYMENLQRISPVVFFKLIDSDPYVNITYQASKVCKLLLVGNIKLFPLRPESFDLIKAHKDIALLPNEEMDAFNIIQDHSDDIDTALRHASVSLLKCDHWQRQKMTLAELSRNCSMMTSKTLPYKWLTENKDKSASERTNLMIYCSCQLLLHKAAWAQLMEDKNVELMSKTLASYMNQVKIPNLQKVPLWAFHGWFENTLKKFEEHRRLTIKEIIKFRHGKQDPTQAINGKTMDEQSALELLRRGCNIIVFNMDKNSKQASEVSLIRYLDNLHYISMDPQFVFHLTLQDPNLFKLYALSKMCKPVVK